MPKGIPVNLVGQRFGSWIVLSRDGATAMNQVLWVCRCDCGNTGSVPTGNLTSGKSKRCRTCGNKRENNVRWTAYRT